MNIVGNSYLNVNIIILVVFLHVMIISDLYMPHMNN